QMFDMEMSSVPFFVIFNSIILVIGYNFWNHFPRENGKYRDPNYYLKLQNRKAEATVKETKVDESVSLSKKGKLLTSCVQAGLDSRSG
ncbi:hypothetical protein PENTCL1PPCAC_9242, partial [Pristionchus entomophagus]